MARDIYAETVAEMVHPAHPLGLPRGMSPPPEGAEVIAFPKPRQDARA